MITPSLALGDVEELRVCRAGRRGRGYRPTATDLLHGRGGGRGDFFADELGGADAGVVNGLRLGVIEVDASDDGAGTDLGPSPSFSRAAMPRSNDGRPDLRTRRPDGRGELDAAGGVEAAEPGAVARETEGAEGLQRLGHRRVRSRCRRCLPGRR